MLDVLPTLIWVTPYWHFWPSGKRSGPAPRFPFKLLGPLSVEPYLWYANTRIPYFFVHIVHCILNTLHYMIPMARTNINCSGPSPSPNYWFVKTFGLRVTFIATDLSFL